MAETLKDILKDVDPKIMDRIQKLLNLSQSSNEHEAAQAAANAEKMMLKYNISRMDLPEYRVEGIVEKMVDTGFKNPPVWYEVLLQAVAEANMCIIFKSIPAKFYGKRYNNVSFVIVGTQRNTEMTWYVYLQLVKRMASLCETASRKHHMWEYLNPNGKSKWRYSWFLGASQTASKVIVKSFNESVAESGSSGMNLVRMVDERIKAYMEIHYSEMGKSTPSKRTTFREAVLQGRSDGEKIDVNLDPDKVPRHAISSGY